MSNSVFEAMIAALEEIEAALRKDSRDKSILADTVEYHLDGQAMYVAINKARSALALAREYAAAEAEEGREPTCR